MTRFEARQDIPRRKTKVSIFGFFFLYRERQERQEELGLVAVAAKGVRSCSPSFLPLAEFVVLCCAFQGCTDGDSLVSF